MTRFVDSPSHVGELRGISPSLWAEQLHGDASRLGLSNHILRPGTSLQVRRESQDQFRLTIGEHPAISHRASPPPVALPVRGEPNHPEAEFRGNCSRELIRTAYG